MAAQEVLKNLLEDSGFDGSIFIQSVEESVSLRKKRNKTPKQIRFYHYCLWARELRKMEIGPENCQYTYPAEVLDFIRHIAPGDIVGEFREDAYRVRIEEFADALGIPRI